MSSTVSDCNRFARSNATWAVRSACLRTCRAQASRWDFADGPVTLVAGAKFEFDLTDKPGDQTRAYLPHPEIFSALRPGSNLLLDDGKLRLRVVRCAPDSAQTEVVVGGRLSERKGVNVPDVVLPLSALTQKDRRDLEFALDLGVEWLALSFVQRPEDLDEARTLTQGTCANHDQAREAFRSRAP